MINHCRNVLAFIIQVEHEFGSVSQSTFDAYCETIARQGLFAGNLVLVFVMGWALYVFAGSTGIASSFSKMFQE